MSLSSPKGGFLHGNDKQGSYPDSYYTATANPHEPLPSLQGEQSCDVCVIGGGYAGLSSALHLRKKGYKVIVLEAHRVGWGASGRNGGQVCTGQRLDQDALEKMVGASEARLLWDIAVDGIQMVKDLVAEHSIACDLKPGTLHADHKPHYAEESKAYVDKLNKQYGYEQIRYVDKGEVEQMVGTKAYYGGMVDMFAAHLHPLNYALGLGQAVRKAGAEIFENSEVRSIDKGETVTVKSDQGQVKAKYLILACNGYIENLVPKVASRVMPMNNYVLATEPLDDALARSLIRDDLGVADSKFVVNYYRLSADKRLLFGGGETYSFKFPEDIKSFVRRPMLEIYPQLKDVRIDYGWGGTLGITVNRMPYFSKLDKNILNASGFSGHGVAIATIAGKILADTIDGQAGRFDAMEHVPTYPFPGGRHLRYALLVLAMLYYKTRDRIGTSS
ncbi:FAD-binding oxidoreductase [uncultured Cohaesibacter sp.]|uniref:NAD(P)/FAD-dependent oxidoreductase n=1 Tax=uncultured Cohaesibacter sp. TaxID=1002546 RepID=UPI0029C98260|nr:FAD-binding oxidoreductase [uncultured Cohaesibacter sp.]